MPDPDFTFKRFITRSRNELAAAAARRVAESPGSVYNPLLVRGGPGRGKTHLLHAIAELASTLDPDLRVHLDNAVGLADLVTRAVVGGGAEAAANILQDIEILLIDELETISGLDRTQEELAHLATAMTRAGRQVVFASRLAPAEIPGLTRSLREVLDRGTVVDIDPPEAELRLAIAQQAAADLGEPVSMDVLRALAGFEVEDARLIRKAVADLVEIGWREGRDCLRSDVFRVLPEAPPATEEDEFGSFLSDISKSVAAVVETAPWRRRIAEAILRWEGEGVRTTRLDEALDTDTPPDVDSLLESFERDAKRLLKIQAELVATGDVSSLNDPDEIERGEAHLRHALGNGDPRAPSPAAEAVEGVREDVVEVDAWFLNAAKVVLDWVDLEGRLAERPR